METYTAVHVALSLASLVSGFVVLFGFIAGKSLDEWGAFNLITITATSLTGLGFPAHHVAPGHIIGILSLAVIALGVFARYARELSGGWRSIYVISTAGALYLDVFVAIVQAFLKDPGLHALAPTQSEPPFVFAQLTVTLVFVVLTTGATIRFRHSENTLA
jgi:hypothetical protein